MGECIDKPNEKGGAPRAGESSPLIIDSVVGRIEVSGVATQAEVRSDPDGTPLVESLKSQVDGWSPQPAALVDATDDPDALATFYKEQTDIEKEIREHEKRYEETGEPIASDGAVALARRIKELLANPLFTGRDDYVVYLAGKCLTLKEGRSEGDVYAATVKLEVKDPPPGFPGWFSFRLAIPVSLPTCGADLPFGVQTFPWLGSRLGSFLLARERQGFPPGSRSYHLFDDGDFMLVLDPARATKEPEEGAIPVMLAPDEATIREYIGRVESSADLWNALVKAAKLLTAHGQPLGEALQAWTVNKSRRPDGRKVAKSPKNALRNHAIIEAVQALERCGIPRTRNRDKRWLARAHGWNGEVDPDYDPPSGAAIVADVFQLPASTAEGVLLAKAH